MNGNLLKLLLIFAGGAAAKAAFNTSTWVLVGAIGAIAVAIIIWNLWRGGTATVRRSRTGYLSFQLRGARARRQTARRRTAASPAQSGVPSGRGVPAGEAPGPYTPQPATGSTSRIAGIIGVVLLAFGGGVWGVTAILHSPAPAHASEAKQSPRVVQTQPVVSTSHLGPKATVEAYFAAINRHDWKAVWQIWHVATEPGHRSLYRRIAIGYRETKQDVITSIHTHGDVVHVRVLAYETTGAVQTYAFRYVVHRGHITQGWSRLLSTNRS
jgi:hypothetical protein